MSLLDYVEMFESFYDSRTVDSHSMVWGAFDLPLTNQRKVLHGIPLQLLVESCSKKNISQLEDGLSTSFPKGL